MSFFIWHLTHDHWKTPWTFILVSPHVRDMRVAKAARVVEHLTDSTLCIAHGIFLLLHRRFDCDDSPALLRRPEARLQYRSQRFLGSRLGCELELAYLVYERYSEKLL
jgi:hypothetical protein